MRKKKSTKSKKRSLFIIVENGNEVQVYNTLEDVRSHIVQAAEMENMEPYQVEGYFEVYEVKRAMKFKACPNFTYHLTFE